MGSIVVSNLGKAYKHYPTRWGRLAEWIIPGARPRHTVKTVLQDVSFSARDGESLGVIGINGAGKSTLLKMITGTTQPTTGSVQVQGRVAALLELGLGFHPDFTGRENAFMAGQLLGYSAAQMQDLLPGIEAFAEIGDYIDEPVRVYSSGMQVRLAFSVATATRPDVLIVDEALSVGDAYFQHKSFARIREFNREGTTLVIVSHDKAAIQSICSRAILLDGGRVALEGEPEAVMDYYNALLADRESGTVRQTVTESGKVQTISGNREATIDEVVLLDEQDNRIEVVNVGQVVKLRVALSASAELPELVLGYMIKDRLGQPVFGTNTFHLGQALQRVAQGTRVGYVFRFPANLGEGSYSIAIAAHASHTHVARNYEWRDLAVVFSVVNMDKQAFVGTAWLPPEIERLA